MGRRYNREGLTTGPLVRNLQAQVPAPVLLGNHLTFLSTDNIPHLIICFNITVYLQEMVKSTFVEGSMALSSKIRMHLLVDPEILVLEIYLKYILYVSVVISRIIVK